MWHKIEIWIRLSINRSQCKDTPTSIASIADLVSSSIGPIGTGGNGDSVSAIIAVFLC